MAEMLNSLRLLSRVNIRMSFIKIQAKANETKIYSDEKMIDTVVYPTNGKVNAIPRELISIPAKIHWYFLLPETSGGKIS